MPGLAEDHTKEVFRVRRFWIVVMVVLTLAMFSVPAFACDHMPSDSCEDEYYEYGSIEGYMRLYSGSATATNHEGWTRSWLAARVNISFSGMYAGT